MIDRLKREIKQAMKNKDKKRLTVLRSLLSGAKNAALDSGGDREPTQEHLTAVVSKAIKQRNDSIAEYESAGRDDLAQQEQYELKVIKEFQPEQLSEEDIENIVDDALSATGASSKADMGKVMGAVMPKVKGKADGSLVKKVVLSRLA
ncbi:MAG: GatB/YqeY domain-containing protein [Fibrobacterota bacterium]